MDSIELAWKIRRHAIDMVNHAHASHIGGILSCTDIVAVLFNDIAKLFPKNPKDMNRDRIVLSKGHNGVAVYSALAELGFFDIEKLREYGEDGSIFSCHISHKNVPGIEITTGSLGQGVCVACGMALNAKLRSLNYKTYAIVGDGECNEGSVWETVMLANQYKLDNFTVIVDINGMQAMGATKCVMDMEPLTEKWKAFGWYVVELMDGHDHKCLKEAFEKNSEGKPKVILARTVKGKGISFMEGELLWHYRDPQDEFYERAVRELEESRNA